MLRNFRSAFSLEGALESGPLRNSNRPTTRFEPVNAVGLKRGAACCAPTQKLDLAVGKHLLDAGHVCFVHQRQLLQLAHTAGPFCTHQVALAGVPALDFAVRRELEALPGAAVGLQFQFWFRCVPWHCLIPSPEIRWWHRGGRTEVRRYMIMIIASLLMRSFSPTTATAGRWMTAVPRFWRRSRLSSGPARPPGRCLPCAAWFRSGPGRQSP